jgi:glycosyltransferase involved in cell wall biosynthesis
MRILIATDAWYPQVNGVVQTLVSVGQALERMGVEVSFLTPEGIPSVPLPTYPDIRLALPSSRAIARRIDDFQPDVIHIATEGPIGHFVRRHCLKRRRGFTTSFHTRFADYAAARWPIPRSLSWSWLRWFHNAGRVTMASTDSLTNELMARGFRKLMRWPRGVDTKMVIPIV